MPPRDGAPQVHPATHVGIGYDSHRFAQGGPLVLGGVRIPAEFHLHGHSDGDAIAHALTDALLGAAGLGDIGTLYPPADPANRGMDSMLMLAEAVRVIASAGWRVQQADLCVVAEKPAIAPHREAMRKTIAGVLKVPESGVSIKGKSNEGMGWVGRGEGLACMAVATLVK